MSPRETYEQRLATHRADAARLRTRERTISIARLAAIALIVLFAFLGWVWPILAPVVAFAVLLVVHEPVIVARKRAEAAAAFCERGIERTGDAWRGKGDRGDEFADEHHPFSGDLDVFGRGSLFELISIASTASGRRTLANWLLTPASAAEAGARQAAVTELRDRVALREDLAVAANEVKGTIEAAALGAWAAAPATLLAPRERVAGFAITALNVVTVVPAILAFMRLASPSAALPFFAMIAVSVVFGRRVIARVQTAIGAVERGEPALALLAKLLARLEREPFAAPELVALQQRFAGTGAKEIERLRRLVALLDSARNQLFMPLAALLLWQYHVAYAIERWRVGAGRDIATWIDAVGELEALSSFAAFAFEHPELAMPHVVEGDARFEATAVAHPLIDASRRVANDVRLGGELRLLVISGSNMSGKSTMMRTIGVNTILALAGAPVCAASLTVTPMAVGASIRIHDSLQEGASRFYAEIVRIRELMEMARREPRMLFLVDEILHGTNSHDRRIGAEAIVRGLVERGAIGCVSTHDLTLADVADALGGRAANVHFEDQFEEGEMRFDYRMRPGVVRKSNALALMRTIGLDV